MRKWREMRSVKDVALKCARGRVRSLTRKDQKQEFVDMDGPKLFSNKTQMVLRCTIKYSRAALFVSTFGDVRWRDRRKETKYLVLGIDNTYLNHEA
ncbi:hypothetical protein CUMW_074510 [Citrus unshiu]|nr:hypothetical protein CUMW_074510 [Citrus unshiu]